MEDALARANREEGAHHELATGRDSSDAVFRDAGGRPSASTGRGSIGLTCESVTQPCATRWSGRRTWTAGANVPLIPAGKCYRRERECEAKKPTDAHGVVHGASPDTKQSNTGGGEHVIDELVSRSSFGCVVGSVVEFDGEHDGGAFGVAKNEVEVLLRDSAAVTAKPISR